MPILVRDERGLLVVLRVGLQLVHGGVPMMRRVLFSVPLAALTSAIALAAPATAHAEETAKSITPDAPPSGLDADLRATLDAAERKIGERDPIAAMKLVMPVFAAPNRFSKAQAPLLVPRSGLVLRQAGQQALAAGKTEDGLRAYEAAWQIDPHDDPTYARALVDRADEERKSDPGAALWMVRHAEDVSPGWYAARERDDTWSHNQLRVPAYAVAIAGLASVAAGFVFIGLSKSAQSDLSGSVHDRSTADDLVSKQRTFGLAAVISFGAGAAALATGAALLWLGNPKGAPTSPSYLPAFRKEVAR